MSMSRYQNIDVSSEKRGSVTPPVSLSCSFNRLVSLWVVESMLVAGACRSSGRERWISAEPSRIFQLRSVRCLVPSVGFGLCSGAANEKKQHKFSMKETINYIYS